MIFRVNYEAMLDYLIRENECKEPEGGTAYDKVMQLVIDLDIPEWRYQELEDLFVEIDSMGV